MNGDTDMNMHAEGVFTRSPSLSDSGQAVMATFEAAIRGEDVVDYDALKGGHGLCVPSMVSGIRHHLSFATASAVEAFCVDGNLSKPVRDKLTRARNARLIMSNIVPMIADTDAIPYCIWYPDIAEEETYRQLARDYPAMRYQVGRACAVAGYLALYRELNVLPEISIAEEARESDARISKEIYDDIMNKSTRYAVMDDYTRTVKHMAPRAGAFLNGDTAVAVLLKTRISLNGHRYLVDVERSFDICEDQFLSEQSSRKEVQCPPELLHNPLPFDLPTVHKDILIQMAAYEGNIDRFSRLKRPRVSLTLAELACVIRGVYHNTTFAKWCAQQADSDPWGPFDDFRLKKAINARAIMCNDLTRIQSYTDGDENDNDDNDDGWEIPYLIWYPLKPRWQTLEKLVEIRPDMKQAVAHASIVCDYKSTFDKLCVEPNRILLAQARLSHNKYYEEALSGGDDSDLVLDPYDHEIHAEKFIRQDMEPTTVSLLDGLPYSPVDDFVDGKFDGLEANSKYVEAWLWAPEHIRRAAQERGMS